MSDRCEATPIYPVAYFEALFKQESPRIVFANTILGLSAVEITEVACIDWHFAIPQIQPLSQILACH